MTYLLNPQPKPVALDFVPVVAIEESSSTVGIADSDLFGMSEADIVKTFDEMQTLGVDTVRVLVPWGAVQPYNPGFLGGIFAGYRDWSKVDFIVNQAVERGMGVLGVLNSTPYWGGQDGTGCLGCYGAAPDPEKFAVFAGEVASHFGGDISAYEVWNEPNYVQSWSPTIDPVAYTEVLKQAYTAIKAANGDATVVAGLLGTVVNFGGITMDARDFVETMYANGALGFFDALSIHPYQYTTKFSEGGYTWYQPWNADSPLEQLIAIRQLMIDNGDEALRIWASEYGLPTAGPNAVTEQEQADSSGTSSTRGQSLTTQVRRSSTPHATGSTARRRRTDRSASSISTGRPSLPPRSSRTSSRPIRRRLIPGVRLLRPISARNWPRRCRRSSRRSSRPCRTSSIRGTRLSTPSPRR